MGRQFICRRLERFFDISALPCSECGELGLLVDRTDYVEIQREATFFGIRDMADWGRVMDDELVWILSHEKEVLAALPSIEGEWKESCKSIRMILAEERKKCERAQKSEV